MIRVLVVEDSPTIATYLKAIFEQADMKVVGCVGDGGGAVAAVETLRPDVVTMDIQMPKMDGLEATRRIMETRPVPIVIVSGLVLDQTAATFRAVEAGALCFVRRPGGIGEADQAEEAASLVQTVRLMSEVKVVRRWKKPVVVSPAKATEAHKPPKLVAIGASTGGPQALRTILAALPASYPLPILVVQHISPGFLGAFVDWLQSGTALAVGIAQPGILPQPGQVWIAPDGAHLGIDREGRLSVGHGPAEYGLRPSVSALFRSVSETLGGAAVGVLLTGMGQDGARELKTLRDSGALTLAQDEDSSVVHGMPGAAIALGAAAQTLNPEEIGALLADLARR